MKCLLAVHHGLLQDLRLSSDGRSLELDYDQRVTYGSNQLSGFYYCCLPDEQCREAETGEHWPEVPLDQVQDSPSCDRQGAIYSWVVVGQRLWKT